MKTNYYSGFICEEGKAVFDIHSHILPGVDDGSGNMYDSIEMLQLAADSGTLGIVATPHCNIPGVFDNYYNENFCRRLEQLKKTVKEKNILIEIYSGQEVFLATQFEEHLKNNELITINNSRYMLTELDFKIDEKSAIERLQKLISYGYLPIISHPERYGFVVENPGIIAKLRSLGCLVQVNSGSVIGYFGHRVQKTADIILRNRLADFVASDAHSQYSRTPDLSQTHELICENISYSYADVLLKTNPFKVINNETI